MPLPCARRKLALMPVCPAAILWAVMSATIAWARCPSYDRVEASLRALLAGAAGALPLPRPGQRVFIKPNLLTDAEPDQAITTHPEVVRAIIRIVRENGAIPSVGDSPASALRLERVWDRTGFRRLCDEEQVPLVNLEEAGAQPFEFEGASFSIARPVLDADLLINVPKVKTHVLTHLTAGVKNLYGTLPGYQKTTLHKTFPGPGDMGRLLAHIAPLVKPRLTIADAVVGMEGNGPSGGTPVRLGYLAAATDPASLDAALCRALGIAPARLPWFAHMDGRWMDDREIGEVPPPGSLRMALPPRWRTLPVPRLIARMLSPLLWVRPRIRAADCRRCGRCAAACPAKALAWEAGAVPVLAPRSCIGCCCCHEVCPARCIEMRASPLLTLATRGRLMT